MCERVNGFSIFGIASFRSFVDQYVATNSVAKWAHSRKEVPLCFERLSSLLQKAVPITFARMDSIKDALVSVISDSAVIYAYLAAYVYLDCKDHDCEGINCQDCVCKVNIPEFKVAYDYFKRNLKMDCAICETGESPETWRNRQKTRLIHHTSQLCRFSGAIATSSTLWRCW